MKGEVERARELWSDARQVYVDAGLLMTAATFAQGGAEIAFRAGDLHSEEALLRDSLEILEEIGERGFYSTQALMLAECLYRAGADDREIEELCAKARETTAADDLMNFVWLDMVGGLLHARRGEYEQAEERSRRAVALAENDGPPLRAVVLPCVPRRGLGAVRSERRGSGGGGGGVRDLRGEG